MELTCKKGDILLALEDFDGLTEDELSFRQGDRITYIEKDASGWAAGKLTGKVGWFPVSFVEPATGVPPPVGLPPPPAIPAPAVPKLAPLEIKLTAPPSDAKPKSPLDFRKPAATIVQPIAKPAPAVRGPTTSAPPVPNQLAVKDASMLNTGSAIAPTVKEKAATDSAIRSFADRTSKLVTSTDSATAKPNRTSKIPEPLSSPVREPTNSLAPPTAGATAGGSGVRPLSTSSNSVNSVSPGAAMPPAAATPTTPATAALNVASNADTKGQAQARNAKNRQQRKTKCLITQDDFSGFEQFEANFKQQAPVPEVPVEENSILGTAKYRNSVRIAKWIEQRKTIGDLEKANIFVPQTKNEETKQKKNVLDRFFKKDVEKRTAPAAATAPAAKEDLKKAPASAVAPEPKRAPAPKDEPKKPKPKEEKKDKRKTIFGLPFEMIMIGKKGTKLPVPRVMEDCLRYLGRPDRLAEPGLFRISGDHIQMEKFKGAYQTPTDSVDFEKHKVEPHTVAGLLKQFFKEMPEPLFPFSVSDTILTEVEKVPEQKIEAALAAKLLKLVPPSHRPTVDNLFLFLYRVTEHSAVNMMNSMNLALVLGPTLIRPSVATTESLLKRNDSRFVESLLSHYAEIFGPPPEEPKHDGDKKDKKEKKEKKEK